MSLVYFFGILSMVTGIAIALLGMPAQIHKTWKNQSTQGLSLTFWIIACINVSFWTVYGLLKTPIDWFIVATNVTLVVGSGTMLFQFLLYRGSPRKESKQE
jgi:uncharacterized protein with PQ loop repeat